MTSWSFDDCHARDRNLTQRRSVPETSGWEGVDRLSNCRSHYSAGAPSFAYFAKGGYDDGIHNG